MFLRGCGVPARAGHFDKVSTAFRYGYASQRGGSTWQLSAGLADKTTRRRIRRWGRLPRKCGRKPALVRCTRCWAWVADKITISYLMPFLLYLPPIDRPSDTQVLTSEFLQPVRFPLHLVCSKYCLNLCC
jgi:hypothetical protein